VNTDSGAIVDHGAREFVQDVYRTRRREVDEAAVDHSVAVARLLQEDGQPDTVVLAGLLHDVLEDTDVTPAELRQRFGPEATSLVEAMTQDPAIADYERRKASLRDQILDAGRDAATIALADKTAKLMSESERPQEQRLAHYRATLAGIEQRYGRSPLSSRLHRELDRFAD
jgi:(p)ppGpp synthase/HD superfamily hydrolase